jgi:hypothetical protein
MSLKSLLREPLLHFVVIGAAMFLYFEWGGGGSAAGSNRIALTTAQIEHLAAGYTKAWRRPPNEAELKGLIDDWVQEEIAVREALAAGLDRDDTLIRRRLRQKLEFLFEDSADATPPTDQQLQAWMTAHADALRIEPQVALSQVTLSRERRGAAADADAAALLARLQAGSVRVDEAGDATMLPPVVELSAWRDVDRHFGAGFAKRLEAAPVGTWSGPFASGYGLHLVLVHERVAGTMPQLADVRGVVEREFLADRRKAQLAAMYEGLLSKYKVVLDAPAARAAPVAPASPTASSAASAARAGS